MKIESNFSEVVSSCGNVLRGHVEAAGREYLIEGDVEKTWLNIIDSKGRCEACEIDSDGDVISEGGECITADWTDEDWRQLKKFVGAHA